MKYFDRVQLLSKHTRYSQSCAASSEAHVSPAHSRYNVVISIETKYLQLRRITNHVFVQTHDSQGLSGGLRTLSLDEGLFHVTEFDELR